MCKSYDKRRVQANLPENRLGGSIIVKAVKGMSASAKTQLRPMAAQTPLPTTPCLTLSHAAQLLIKSISKTKLGFLAIE